MSPVEPVAARMPWDEPPRNRLAKRSDQIIEAIRVSIAGGQISPGERLPNERDLAARFEVSPSTIREVIRALEAMGLVEVQHGRGAFASSNLQDSISRSLQTLTQLERVGIVDVIALRLCLARYSVARAVQHATESNLEQIADLEQKLLESTSAADYPLTTQRALAFLSALSAAAHDPLLFAFESFLSELMLALQLAAWRNDPKGFEEHWKEWHDPFAADRRRLVEALRARDEAAASDALISYLQDQERLFGAFADLSELRVSDPSMITSITDAGLRPPGYRDH